MKEDFFHSEFWQAALERLKRKTPPHNLDRFAYENDLYSFRFDMVIRKNKGLTLESFVRVCNTLDLNPSWILYGIGKENITSLRAQPNDETVIDNMVDILTRLQPDEAEEMKQRIFMMLERRKDEARKAAAKNRPLSHVSANSDGDAQGHSRGSVPRHHARGTKPSPRAPAKRKAR